MQQWKFRPFTLGTQATPVCSLIYLDYPSRPTKEEGGRLPIAFTPPPGALRVPQNQVKRISGERAVQPSHRDRLRLMQSASGPITGSYWYCFDTTGNVIDVGTVVPTGLPDYDARLRAAIAKWKFRPYVLDGTPRTGCSAITFIYGR